MIISSISPNGIFSSIIYCSDKNGKEIELDSRTSDAVAIAIRFKAPIFTYETIIRESGIILEQDMISDRIIQDEDNHDLKDDFKNLSTKELEKIMNESIHNENYELASKIRDEINRRS